MMSMPFIGQHMIVFMGMPDHMRMRCPVMGMSYKMLVLVQVVSDKRIPDNKDCTQNHNYKRCEVQICQPLS
ncbi:hypothetical protein CQR53_1742 [Bifidobacterium pseudolongum subsp. globosum]|uniref:Uncharacterized protein n=1 Tax=Bifidobacterium pseudolongum subsp. globosum TaxID=1690 RepID=A0A2N3QQP9_9BIFI|nr:hypothetical protein CQR56_1679 [Bifidobacterium pseudolongum subsp. globosum]PKV01856.1 hypothetical protein CQR53_1742 [Bifidobacterium pseudolongum subsp. globosum]RYQ45893.1 hypothetical protein PG1791B_0452 [Bifidobacterium pseudolongum subsp. globosum]RYQ47635.1 hypothetical protein PG1780B_0412 [Bifidobacterium pseudolongum subsp. globosum]RYQ72214.1 hypothetical protein PG1678B_1651 [Bifidobacterium pseudolongum subsp. globosum]